MILDMIVLAILTLPAAFGLFRGFAHTFLYALGWLGALIGGLLLASPAAHILRDTFLADAVFGRISDKFDASAKALETAFEGLPGIVSGGLSITEGQSADIFAEMLTSLVITIIAFLAIFLAIRLALGVLIASMRNRERFSLLRGANKLLGLVAGLLEGVILVFVFLALLVPLIDLADPALSSGIVSELESAAIAGDLYHNNLLLLITGGLFS